MVFSGGAYTAVAETLATVNGVALSREDVSLALSQMNESVREAFLKQRENRERALDDLIDLELFAQQAKATKLDQTAEYKRMKVQAERELLARLYADQHIGKALTSAALKKYYEEHKSRYRADRYHVQQIVLLGQKEAERVLKAAKAKGADFQALAEKFSKDPTVSRNRGDLGFIPRGTFVPDFEDRIFRAKKGEIVGPISTTYGYHIVKILGFASGPELTFEEVELRVRADLQKELMDEQLVNLRKNAKVQIDRKKI